jgi:hypothetical protein
LNIKVSLERESTTSVAKSVDDDVKLGGDVGKGEDGCACLQEIKSIDKRENEYGRERT